MGVAVTHLETLSITISKYRYSLDGGRGPTMYVCILKNHSDSKKNR